MNKSSSFQMGQIPGCYRQTILRATPSSLLRTLVLREYVLESNGRFRFGTMLRIWLLFFVDIRPSPNPSGTGDTRNDTDYVLCQEVDILYSRGLVFANFSKPWVNPNEGQNIPSYKVVRPCRSCCWIARL